MDEKKIVSTENKTKKKFTLPKRKHIKNQFLFKRGAYSVAITAIVLGGIIILNVLLSALNNRFLLEYDMTSNKVNTISEENIEYIKKIDTEVTVTMCALAQDYYSGSMNDYAQYQYGITENYNDYYKQTVNLIEKYNNYNKKIKVKFVDTQDASFADITAKYSNDQLNYGDIIVSCTRNGVERYKIIGFKDIYNITEDDTYANMGYIMSTIDSNNIETALTSAIAYATSLKSSKVAFITGHSKKDTTEVYRKLLETNNYEVDLISDKMITEISDKYDAIFIAAPTSDFIESELDAIADYLDNDEKYNKGLVFFADAAAPYLPNLYGFLEEWGITIDAGILFETNTSNHLPETPTTLGSYPVAEDEIVEKISLCISGSNVPMVPAYTQENSIKVTTLMSTPASVVGAPVGTSNAWNGADDYEPIAYSTVIQSQRAAYDDENNLITNNVIAFSSCDFIYSEYSEYNNVGNKNVALAAAERASGADNTGISFVSKVITDESFATSVTEEKVNLIIIIFLVLLPLACIAAGIYVFIRRKNS